jgi:hypothetical protein
MLTQQVKELKSCSLEVSVKHLTSLKSIDKGCKDDTVKSSVTEHIATRESLFAKFTELNTTKSTFFEKETLFKEFEEACKTVSGGKFRFKEKSTKVDEFANCAEGCLDKIPLTLAYPEMR